MDWTSLVGPAVVAAVISGLVATVGIWISARTARRIHTEKLRFDREEAERTIVREVEVTEAKIKADNALVERRFEVDQKLAERRFAYDCRFNDHKRRVELAEEFADRFPAIA